MVNPLIIAKGAQALGAATKGAAVGATKIAMTEKAAKATASTFKSIKDTTEMGGFQQLENFASNIKNSGPVMASLEQLGGKFTAGTIDAKVELMERLNDAFESPAGKLTIELLIALFNLMILGSAELITGIDKLMNLIKLLMESDPELLGEERFEADTGDEQTDAIIDYYTGGSGWWGGW